MSSNLERICCGNWPLKNVKTESGESLFTNFTVYDASSRVIILYGENASGKSLLAQLFEIAARKSDIACRAACMRNRTSSGIMKAMIFGDESEQSTGATSIDVTRKAIDNTLKEEGLAISILDEPDVGLSDYYAPAMGQYIAERFSKADDNKGLILVSHSKRLITKFLKCYDGEVSSMGINTNLQLAAWLQSTDKATVDEMFEMASSANAKMTAIFREMNK